MTTVLNAQHRKSLQGGASFTLSNRLYRLIWSTVWLCLAHWTPAPLRGWRRFILRTFGAKIDHTAVIYGTAEIWSPANLRMDRYACIGPKVKVYSMAPISLGEYSIISQGAFLCAGTHDVDDEHFQLRTNPILIGAHAWVAAEAFVGPGVTIGEGAVLGARGVAAKNLAPWTIYVGNPAQATRARKVMVGASRDE